MSGVRNLITKTGRRIFYMGTAAIIIGIAAVIAWSMHVTAGKLPIRQYFSDRYTNAVWDWSDPAKRSEHDVAKLADFMHLHQLNAVYVDAGKYAGGTSAEQKDLDAALERYVQAMQKYHIRVYATAGDVNWSEPPNWQYPLAVMKAVEAYNQHHASAQLAGVEFDIEAYNQQGFPESSMAAKSLVLQDWLGMVNTLANENERHVAKTHQDLELGFAIPYWFDNENGNIPSVTWNQKTGPTLYHLMDRLNQLPKSNVVVMAYRNAAKGNDGVIFHSRTEVDYAQTKAPHVRVMVGQEVNDVEPAKITYYGMSSTDFSNQVALIESAFGNSEVFGGIAINDLAGYQNLDRAGR